MGEDMRAKIEAAVSATQDDLLRLARADAEQLARCLVARDLRGEATDEERAALADHRALLALT